MNKLSIIIFALCLNALGCNQKDATQNSTKINTRGLVFFVISDFGDNGYDYQKQVAESMGRVADSLSPEFIISSGDQFHVNGIRSINDPLWHSNFESIYTKPSLLVNWYPVLGNHEYHGNTQALVDYSSISRRWNMPAHYYTLVKKVNDSVKIRLVFIDTPPFVEKYRKDSAGYPDACKQDINKQLQWIDSVLTASAEKWKIVIGHHPIYSIDDKHGSTPELIEKLKPVLVKHKVDFYFAGHIHNFQHLAEDSGPLDYIVTSSACRPRPDSANYMTKFSSPLPGFDICSVTTDTFYLYFADTAGRVIYQYQKAK
jgi:hypothetical protein